MIKLRQFFIWNWHKVYCFKNGPSKCDTGHYDKDKLPLLDINVGSYNNLPDVLICSSLWQLFLCNLQILPPVFSHAGNFGTAHSRRGNNEWGRKDAAETGYQTWHWLALWQFFFDNNIFCKPILLGVISRLQDAKASEATFPWKQRVSEL